MAARRIGLFAVNRDDTSIALSDEQNEIVDYALAPLRVAAGAGTGKTTTVVARVVSSVRAGMEPERVLGLTFTNKAAEELADRLRAALPDMSRAGREADVTTYHGFAWRMLQELGAVVGIERTSTIIGPGYVRQLVLESLAQANHEPLDLTAPAQRVSEVALLARQLSENLRGPDDLLAIDDPAPDDIRAKRYELAAVVRRFEDTKRRLDVVDHGDLIRHAHLLVSTHPEIARRLRDRYALVVLDEYQDTDPAQRTLLQEIFGGGFPVTAVGDESQIVYEWRGASPENFAGFPEDFPDRSGSAAKTLPLTINRRSARSVIDVANRVLGVLQPTAGLEPLRPLPNAAAGAVEARYFRTAGEEAHWVAEEVERLHAEEDTPWNEIAVLFRKNANISLVRNAIEARDIPVEVASLGGLLDVPDVADLHAWLRILDRPEDSAAVARILLAGSYRLGLGDLAPLSAWVKNRNRAPHGEGDDAPGWPLLEAIDQLETVDGLSGAALTRLSEFRVVYRRLLTAAQSLTLVELCREVLDTTETWAEVEARPDAAALSARLNLYRFLDLAEEWSPLRGRPSVTAFLDYLDALTEERATDELDTARVGGNDAVALLTVHRAKGLEWDAVFIPGTSKGVFPAGSLGQDNPLQRAAVLPFELRIDRGSLPTLDGGADDRIELGARHDRQEWRTAYVAVTRARNRLYLSGAFWYSGRRPRPPSALFRLAADSDPRALRRPIPVAGERPEMTPDLAPTTPPDPLFGDGWEAALRRALDDPEDLPLDDREAYDDAMEQFELMLEGLPPPLEPDPERPRDVSVTGLVTMAQCPKRFQWTAIDPLPRRPAPARVRGVEVHRRIELFNRGQMPLEDADDVVYDAVDVEGAEPAGDSPFDVFRRSRFAERPAYVETPIDLHLDAGRVRGRIDAIYQRTPDQWEIVDYKTGRRSADAARIVQLQAYAVAVDSGAVAATRPQQLTVTFAYLGGGSVEEESWEVSDEFLGEAYDRVNALVAATAADDFDASPGSPCHTCDFVRFCAPGRRYLDAATA